jgi:hypothetical protein
VDSLPTLEAKNIKAKKSTAFMSIALPKIDLENPTGINFAMSWIDTFLREN